MKTYNDLLALGDNEEARKNFILEAISEHKSTSLYTTALAAQQYYDGLNPTIMHYEKVLYDTVGAAHKDKWSANHKIASNFFNFAITQENQYLLGNGAIFVDKNTKDKLGADFEVTLQKLGKYALIGGVSFGFWNFDKLEAFSVLEFAPLYDEESGKLMAGIRFWQIDGGKPLRATLYEIDGYTEYIKREGAAIEEYRQKRPYKLKIASSPADGDIIYDSENYANFPIVPLWGNDKKQSELVGRQGTLDAFDLLNSNLVNNVDEANYIYWVLTNCDGMTDIDDAKFIERLKTMHVAHADGDGGNGATAEAHTVEAPFQASEAAIAVIKNRLYEDFMCLNVADISAGNKTATEIRAAYQPLDSKCDMYEYCVIEFVDKILALAGIDDEVSFKRSKIINTQEEIQSILSAAEYLDDEFIVKQICSILGVPDEADEILNRRKLEESEKFRFSTATNEPQNEDE